MPLFNSATPHHQSNSTPMVSPPHPRPLMLAVDPTVSKSSTSTLQDHSTSNYPLPASIDVTFLELTSKELPTRTKIYEFYNAPITKFWAYSVGTLRVKSNFPKRKIFLWNALLTLKCKKPVLLN